MMSGKLLLVMRTCSPNREWTSELYVQREPTERVIIVIVAEKEEKRERDEKEKENE